MNVCIALLDTSRVLQGYTHLPFSTLLFIACLHTSRVHLFAEPAPLPGSQLSINSRFVQDTTQLEVVADKLNLSAYCSTAGKAPVPVYRLTAVTNHYGSLASGHYTAHCRSLSDDRWCNCDDKSVREENGVEGPSSSAYLLFYRRQD